MLFVQAGGCVNCGRVFDAAFFPQHVRHDLVELVQEVRSSSWSAGDGGNDDDHGRDVGWMVG